MRKAKQEGHGMSDQKITQTHLTAFGEYLLREEKSTATVEKYLRDARAFVQYAEGKTVSKELTVAYKKSLEEKGYKPRSINSMLASLNSFLGFIGAGDSKVKTVRIQKLTYLAEEKELTNDEYKRLLAAAKHKAQLNLAIRTICATGIRVSELKYFTVKAVRLGEVSVKCKSKTRTILVPGDLRKLLLSYANKNGIADGVIFVTRNGKPLDRSYIWAQMKDFVKRRESTRQRSFHTISVSSLPAPFMALKRILQSWRTFWDTAVSKRPVFIL